ncbi:YcjF family protein [Calothrix sp. UHCC 0171]|uniref:YcjF family protein n=1 Tax=Calothrix sp. UHCC 0171 TaxID=3110245 RepID=UPI002B1F038B|nr:GTPase [Calothrix sp. UHCC 0171]MEA5572918.1 GTPase [Calothrix sp. UHCC 0171]
MTKQPGDSQKFDKVIDSDDEKSITNTWKNPIIDILNHTAAGLAKLIPVGEIAQNLSGWFNVSEAQMADILEKARSQLPTTEALLIGKPQAGKSSIVRALTGVSAEIIGQGFRPHTQHTQRYAYPSSDLPLILFTDTVGLGDINQDTQSVIQELIGDLQQQSRGARVLILTVKINDFATETLRLITQEIRQKYPNIPCLLAVTCLHEVYPDSIDNHLEYPPNFSEVNRPFAAIKEAFQGLYDRAILIDFTLEEDRYNPVFYGLEELRDNLAELLPEAEAAALNQLLTLDKDASEQIGNLYRDVARRYMSAFAIMAGTLAAIPLPLATMPVLTALQVSMVSLLGKVYGQNLTRSQAGGIVSAIAGGFLAQIVGRELVKFIPGFGSVIAASWAAAYTWSLGEAACVYFGDLMGGKKPEPQQIQAVMKQSFQEAKERFKGMKV